MTKSSFRSGVPVELLIETEDAIAFLVRRLRHYFERAGVNVATLGVSGGVDSAVTAMLCCRALGPTNVVAGLLPASSTPVQDMTDASKLLKVLRIPRRNVIQVPIDSLVEHFEKESHVHSISKLAAGNVKARVRMTLLHLINESRGGLVVGTGDKSELTIGYFTKFGDGGVDLLPIGDLYKTTVRLVAAESGLPENISLKPPSPALWDGQTAEEELGVSYVLLDRILFHRFDRGRTNEEVARELRTDRHVIERVVRRVKLTQHKRLPPEVFKVSARSHGSDWRYPRHWG